MVNTASSCKKCQRLWGTKGKRGSPIKHYAKGLCKSCYNGRVPYRNSPQTLSDPELHKRFESKYVRLAKGECWNWLASCSEYGYGQFMFNAKPMGAHRMGWAIHHQKMPGKMDVCHSCDNPQCVNPNHLWLGTRKQNHRDMIKKGRHSAQKARALLKRVLEECDVSSELHAAIDVYLKQKRGEWSATSKAAGL
jgi:hypothetical protein